MYRNLKCPNCEEKILSSDINLNKELGKCSSCHVVFDLERDVNDNIPAARQDEIFIIPRGIQVLKMLSELEIEMTWRHTTSWFLVVFALMWNGILFPMVVFILISGEYFPLIFMSLHLAIGMGLVYRCLASLFNTTYINVDSRYVTIQHRPFKFFFKESELQTKDIDQLYVRKYSNGSTNGRPNHVFAVTAILNSREEVDIIKGIAKSPQALYIEQEIEKFAGIENRPVDGEF